MLLGAKNHTVGNVRRWFIDYRDWLDDGVTVATFTAGVQAGSDQIGGITGPTGGSAAVAVASPAVVSGHKGVMVVSGGVLNETFTASLVMTDTKGEVKNDTIAFTVVAP